MIMPPSGSSGKMSKFASFIMGLAYGYKGKPGMVKTYPMKEFKGVVPEGATVYYANKKLDVIQKEPLIYNTHIIVVQELKDQLLVEIYKDEE
ncbi:MAG: hypothetical protein RXN95_02095 [Hydrogenobaculum sp.]